MLSDEVSADLPPATSPITGTLGCCARATIGHVAVLPSPAMNVRRFIE
jgi:hypothetical protein